jgi:hypothetical protein
MTRSTWLDILMSMASVEVPLTPDMRRTLTRLDEALFEFWHLGEKIVLAWSRDHDSFRFLGIPHYAILHGGHGDFMNALLAGPKLLPLEEFDRTCDVLADAAHVVGLKFESRFDVPPALIDGLVISHGVTLVRAGQIVIGKFEVAMHGGAHGVQHKDVAPGG